MFSAPMVLAIGRGDKRQTRRLASSPLAKRQPGTILWVRETFRFDAELDGVKPSEAPKLAAVRYEADGSVRRDFQNTFTSGKLRPAIHMPRFAARYGLRLEAVRTEPVQAISEADAIAEGLVWRPAPFEAWSAMPDENWPLFRDPRRSYAGLWRHLHKKEGQRWEDNPLVAVLSFELAWMDK